MSSDPAKLIIDLVKTEKEYIRLRDAVKSEGHTGKTAVLPHIVNGLSDGAADAVTAALVSDLESRTPGAPVLCIVSDENAARRLSGYLNRTGVATAAFPARDLNFYNITASHEFEHERLSVLYSILTGQCRCVVASPDAALSYTVPEEVLLDGSFTLSVGDEMPIDKLCSILVRGGYSRVDLIEGPGQFALRGGIIDIYSPASPPFRAEFFGDETDRIGILDPATQRVTENIDKVTVIPAREVVPDEVGAEKIREAIRRRLAGDISPEAAEDLRGELAALDAAGSGAVDFADKYISLIYPERRCLLDYIGSDALIITRDTAAVEERLTAAEWHVSGNVENLLKEGLISPPFAEYSKDSADLEKYRVSCHNVMLDTFTRAASGVRTGGIYTFRSKQTVSYCDKYNLLTEDLKNYISFGWRVIVYAEGEAGASAITRSLTDDGFTAVKGISENDKGEQAFPPPGVISVLPSEESTAGYEMQGCRLAILSVLPDGSYRRAKKRRLYDKNKKNAGERILSYADLSEGDFVVHPAYGIGRYDGMENLTVAGVSRDYIRISYAGTDSLFLPADQLGNISKYIGAHSDDGLVKLSKMGGAEWKSTSQRAKAATKKMAAELIKLYAQRRRTPGFAFPPDDDLCREFNDSFEYEETDGQLLAEKEIKTDMEASYPMDRLLCGDVGYGKTEVALRAAMKCILSGKQVALLVPTTILAYQHLTTAESRMRPFSVKVDMLSRFRSPTEQAEIIRRVRRGDVDLLIGTHRLLSQDIVFKDLGLLIIDEEQRFGVAQKEKIKQFSGNVDVLTLSATPIPRTLNMAMSGIRDMSLLDEAPGERTPVQTYVLEHDDIIIAEAIRRELRRGGQVFYLYNRVETIERCAAKVAAAVPDARIAIAHGKMDKDQLEDIWQALLTGEIDVLISTTIIETGVDVPNANTLIIEHADRLGLAQLHQIRGRVGRSHRRAYAYLTYQRGKALSEIAEKRLGAIREYTEFGAGFKIALRDLEIRGAGNILGAEQHGHLDAVGYDMYIKLLNEAILEEKGEAPKKRTECKLDMPINAFLSDSYVPTSSQRMEMYKKIATIETEEDCDDVCDELCDRFGELPREAFALCRFALLRALGEKAGFTSISARDGEAIVVPGEVLPQVWLELHGDFPKIKVTMLPSPRVVFRPSKPSAITDGLIDLAKKYIELRDRDAADSSSNKA
ncbi:MAG: transcription-repair coupling factor [Clostridia bacterium]|nr:transcription-repair coupling factor [Clostridia bacterium]